MSTYLLEPWLNEVQCFWYFYWSYYPPHPKLIYTHSRARICVLSSKILSTWLCFLTCMVNWVISPSLLTAQLYNPDMTSAQGIELRGTGNFYHQWVASFNTWVHTQNTTLKTIKLICAQNLSSVPENKASGLSISMP